LRVAVKLHSTSEDAPSVPSEMEVIEQLGFILREIGPSEVALLLVGSAAGRANGSVGARSQQREFMSRPYRWVDCAADQVPFTFSRGLGQYTIAQAWRDADVRILCVDARPSDGRSILEAAEGIGGPYHELGSARRQVDRETAIMMVLDDCPPHVCVLRVSAHARDPQRGRQQLYASQDALALDRAAAELGASDGRSERLRRTAEQWFGTPAHRCGGTAKVFRRPFIARPRVFPPLEFR